MIDVAEKPLSHQRQAFVEEYCRNGHNAAKAYTKAYPDCEAAGCETHGPRLVRDGQVKRAITERMAELRAETGWSVERSQKLLLATHAQATTLKQPSAAVSAVVAINRIHCMDQPQGTGDSPDTLSEEDVATLRAMAKAATELKIGKDRGVVAKIG